MTLRRQLAIAIAVISTVVVTGALSVNLHSTRTLLERELGAHSKGIARALAYSLAPGMLHNDIVLMESVVNAVFDPRLHHRVVVATLDGTPIIDRAEPVVVEGAPDWYVQLVRIDAPAAEADILTNQGQSARVYVYANAGYAYRDLWRTATTTFWWCMGTTLVFSIIAALMLRYYVKPLRKLEAQVNAVSQAQFPKVDVLPRIPELRPLTESLNNMVQSVKTQFAERDERAENWRREALRNPRTGLPNQRGLQAKFGELSGVESSKGVLYLVEFSTDAIGMRGEPITGDDFLSAAVQELHHASSAFDNHLIGQIRDAVLAVLVSDVDSDEAAAFADQLLEELRLLCGWYGATRPACTVHIGMCCYAATGDWDSLLMQAEAALSSAISKGPSSWASCGESAVSSVTAQGSTDWQALFEKVVQGHKLLLYFQPVIGVPAHDVRHYEVLVRLPSEDNRAVPAKAFIPTLYHNGCGARLDKAVVECVAEHLTVHPEATYALNLSSAILTDPQFAAWLSEFLSTQPAVAERLMVELPEWMLGLGEAQSLREELKSMGCEFGVDQFGASERHFGYLARLRPTYIKLDKSVCQVLDRNLEDQLYVSTIADLARRLGTHVIVTGVETKIVWDAACHLGIDAGQGYFLGAPQPSHVVQKESVAGA